MTPFTALDEILSTGAITPTTQRAAATTDFQPLFASALVPADDSRLATQTRCEPQVELVQENGRVQQIVVTCRCGERTVLDCAY